MAADSHKQAWTIRPMVDGVSVRLNTYCADKSGAIWMCCQTHTGDGYLVVATPQGEIVKTIPLQFNPQAINFASSGEIFVAGGGKVARLDAEGQVIHSVDAPNLGNSEQALEEMRQAVEQQVEQIVEQSSAQLKQIDDSIAKLQSPPEGETEREKKRRELRLQALTTQRDAMAESLTTLSDSIRESYMGTVSLARLQTATGIAVTAQDVFVSLPVTTGYGYSVWRLDHDLANPTQVLASVSGCCGQLDIQSSGDDLLVAANTQFEVVRYDRDGKRLSAFGEKNRGSESGFGSCCNPMNVRCCDNGDILTAESSIGHIKRFSPSGEYLGKVGTAKIGGGCKHVAVSYDSSRDYYYMMNVSKGNIAVLVPLDQAPAVTEDERIALEAQQGLGRKLLGVWKLDVEVAAASESPAAEEDEFALEEDEFDAAGYYAQMFKSQMATLNFQAEGKISTKDPAAQQAAAAPQRSNGGFFSALLSAVTGSSTTEQPAMDQYEMLSKWLPIRQSEKTLDLVFIQDDVEAYGLQWEFQDDNTAVGKWFYGDPAEGSYLSFTGTYRRISSPDCESGEECAETSSTTKVTP
jgi:hypothetical protein